MGRPLRLWVAFGNRVTIFGQHCDMNKIGSLLATLMTNNLYMTDHTRRIQVHAFNQEVVKKSQNDSQT